MAKTKPINATSKASNLKKKPKGPPVKGGPSSWVDSRDTFINREISWLAFNQRVLELAQDPSTPLLEKLKFLSIFSSNLDEFFMVRVAGLQTLIKEEITTQEYPSLHLIEDTLSEIRVIVEDLIQKQQKVLREEVLPSLEEYEITLVGYDTIKGSEKTVMDKFFRSNIFPVLTPLVVDPAHPAPFFNNGHNYVVVRLDGLRTGNPNLGFIQVPKVLPRLVPVTPKLGETRYVLTEDLVSSHIGDLFLGLGVEYAGMVRVTRNLDYDLLENEVVDLLKSIQKEVIRREYQEIVRMEVSEGMSKDTRETLMHILKADKTTIISEIRGVFDIPGIMQLYKLPLSILKDEPFNPRIPAVFSSREDIFSILDEQNVMLHHPYESFYPVIELLQSAAHHPDVVAIKQTLYRTSGESPIIDALIEAADRGIQVTAIIELKARFDEKNNIQWARQLERSGVNVVFGFVGLKTHAKATLIIRKKGNKLIRYSHLSTGNYNSSTAKLYTDIGFMTSDKVIGDDLSKMFNLLTGFNIFQGSIRELGESSLPSFQKIILAPVNLRNHTLRLIRDEISFHKKSGEGHIIAKMNALVDPALIQALYEASQAGVKIELIVRGVCCLRPGIKGLSENIHVRSVLDRFLEHSRIFYFHHDGEQLCYLASADWMTRNMIRRIECMFPVEDPELKARLLDEILATTLEDNCQTWVLDAFGSYNRIHAPDEDKKLRSQAEFIEIARTDGVKSLPYDEAIRVKSKAGRRRPLIRSTKPGKRKSKIKEKAKEKHKRNI